MRIIRASEIGEYLYCQRAWWYASQGYQTNNQKTMESGSVFHQRHARLIALSRWLQVLSYSLLAISIILSIASLIRAAF